MIYKILFLAVLTTSCGDEVGEFLDKQDDRIASALGEEKQEDEAKTTLPAENVKLEPIEIPQLASAQDSDEINVNVEVNVNVNTQQEPEEMDITPFFTRYSPRDYLGPGYLDFNKINDEYRLKSSRFTFAPDNKSWMFSDYEETTLELDGKFYDSILLTDDDDSDVYVYLYVDSDDHLSMFGQIKDQLGQYKWLNSFRN